MVDVTARESLPAQSPPRSRRRLRGTVVRWAAPQLVMAVVLGAGWWLLAPGGRSSTDDGYLPAVEALGSQDAWFAVLAMAAGVAVALVWVARRGGASDAGGVAALVGALVGAALGAPVAWATGTTLDTVTASGQAGPTAITSLALRAPGVMLLWPLAVLGLVLIDTAREMTVTWARERPERQERQRGIDAAADEFAD